jgi:hypothetical protein
MTRKGKKKASNQKLEKLKSTAHGIYHCGKKYTLITQHCLTTLTLSDEEISIELARSTAVTLYGAVKC